MGTCWQCPLRDIFFTGCFCANLTEPHLFVILLSCYVVFCLITSRHISIFHLFMSFTSFFVSLHSFCNFFGLLHLFHFIMSCHLFSTVLFFCVIWSVIDHMHWLIQQAIVFLYFLLSHLVRLMLGRWCAMMKNKNGLFPSNALKLKWWACFENARGGKFRYSC